MTKLLISGSRHATNADALERYVYRVVERAKANHWYVVVGDNPHGVDQAVVKACEDLCVFCTVYGIQRAPRNSFVTQTNYCLYIRVASAVSNFTQRDRHMVMLSERVMCVWNGKSKGTRAVYDYAISQGKPADLMVYDLGQRKMVAVGKV